MKIKERIAELLEKRDEFIFNEAVFADDQDTTRNPSWGEVADAQAEAETRWNSTDEGRELIALQKILLHLLFL